MGHKWRCYYRTLQWYLCTRCGVDRDTFTPNEARIKRYGLDFGYTKPREQMRIKRFIEEEK